jgi:hypothetical protein
MEKYLIQLTEPKNGKKHEELEKILKKHKAVDLADVTYLANVTTPLEYAICKELTHFYLVELKDKDKEKIIQLGLATKIDKVINDYTS